MKQFALLIVFVVAALYVSGQGNFETESTTIKIMERSPAAPNTASLGKYFDVPVNLSTGVADIQIPLYTIKSGSITLPISLSYHASGNKVNTPASWVGLGWDINCGGVITKQVNGLDDFFSTTQYEGTHGHPAMTNYLNPDYTMDNYAIPMGSMSAVIDSMHSPTYGPYHLIEFYRIFGRIIQNHYDGESDEYHYSTPEGGGTLFYNQKTASFQMDELNGWKNSYYANDDDWLLISKNGNQYSYTEGEETLSPAYAGNPAGGGYYTSAWYLTGIADVVNSRSISFSYDQSARYLSGAGTSESQDWELSWPAAQYKITRSTPIYRYGRDMNINTITFNEGRVEFIKDTAGRWDGGVKALKKIKIYDNANVLKKQFNLDYMYVYSPIHRLFLKSVQEVNFLDSSTTESKPYLIYYDTSIALPIRYSYAQDIWGYYNGKTSNTTLIPTEWATLVQGLPAFANRRVDSNYTKAGMIKQIVYPTGGSLNLEFENNQDYNDSLVGGLRIKRVINYDSVAKKKLITEYRYNDTSGHSTGALLYKPRFNYTLSIGAMLEPHVRVSGEPILPLFNNQGSPITYSLVEKFEIDDTLQIKSRHFFSNNLAGLGVPDPLTDEGSICVPYQKLPNLMRFSNLQIATEIYKRENGQFVAVQSEGKGYTTLNQFKTSIWNVQAAWEAGGNTWVEDGGADPYSCSFCFFPSFNAYKMVQESVVNDVTMNYTLSGGDVLTQATYKKFDTTNGNLKRITTVASNGDTSRTYFSYSKDFQHTNSSDAINDEIDALLDANVLDAPIEVINTRKTPSGLEYITDANLYLYEDLKLQKHMKLNLDTVLLSGFAQAYNNSTAFYYDSRYETESEVNSFNTNKNPEQISLRNKIQTLIWDKDDITASAINTVIGETAATSFETTQKGGWTYSGSSSSDVTSPTGGKCYNLSGGNITKSSLSGGDYIVSYWGKTGSVNVNSSGPTKTGKTIGSWTYYEHLISSGSSITISGSNYIDELRLYPVGAMMTTYTYNPFVGMTSQCSAANKISYYEFDGLGRLRVIKDEDGKIIKRIDYKL